MRPLANGYIAELDGLRGIAILVVIFHHMWPATGWLEPAKPFVHLGWMGVDLFFVISGFLITGILLDTRGQPGYFRNYLARRALRVFPLYYALVVGAYLLIPTVQHGEFWSTEFVRESGSPWWYLLYMGNAREAITGVEPAYILAPLWSLSIEEQFYLTFPILVALLDRHQLARVLLAMVVLAPLFRAAMLVWQPDNERIQYLATPSRMDVLALGALLAVVVRSGLQLPSRRVVGWSFAGLLVACAVMFAITNGFDRHTPLVRVPGYTLVAITCLTFVVWTLQGRGTRATAWLRFKPLLHIGKLCYGIYILQRPAEVIVLRLLGVTGLALDPESLTLVFVKVAFAFAVAEVSWRMFEAPILALKRRFTTAHHPLADAGSDTTPSARAPSRLVPAEARTAVGVERREEKGG